MNRKIAQVVAVAMFAGTMAWAQGPGGPPCDPGMKRGPKWKGPPAGVGFMRLVRDAEFAKEMGLTENEVSAVRESIYKNRREMIDLHAKAETAKLEVQYLESQPAMDASAVEKAMDEVGKLETEIEKARFRHQEELKKLIGEERWQKITTCVRAQKGERIKQRQMARGRPGQGPGGPCMVQPPPPDDDDDDADDVED
ncbi:MAG: hypothetical protein BWY59_00206 [Verrucomicrobia bacterium ADurb.Bin345]|nr:MAG: hypothetical protein BWY59_00206 [Verrucomicrobia bacterium ADurb.Bin345]